VASANVATAAKTFQTILRSIKRRAVDAHQASGVAIAAHAPVLHLPRREASLAPVAGSFRVFSFYLKWLSHRAYK
jgi:hypothetical protein